MQISAVSREKVVFFNSVNSGDTRPNLTKILNNPDKFMPPTLMKSELRYCNPFRNDNMKNECASLKSPIFHQNWLPRQRPLRDRKMIYQVNKPFHQSTNPEILVKIGLLDYELLGLEVDHKKEKK